MTENTRKAIQFMHRGERITLAAFSPRRTVLDWLREDMRLTGTKEGCAEGDCGACTAVVGRLNGGRLVYQPVNTCILLLGQLDGCELVTVDDLAHENGGDGVLHPVQAALVAHHGSQCGFCTPGIVMSLFALYHEGQRPVTREMVCDALAGNLCRCTGYRPIIDAAMEACAAEAGDRFMTARAGTEAALRELAGPGDVMVGDEAGFFAVPHSTDALAKLCLAHPDATLLGGATDVGLWLTKGLMDLRKIIWLGRIDALRAILNHEGALRIGAGASHADAWCHLAAIDPDLGEVMRRFGSAQVRASGTVGGNIANGSPIGDLAPCLIALGSTVELRRGDDIRTLPLEDFFIAYRQQDRQQSEFVTAVTVPKLQPGQEFRAFKVSKRVDEDISAVMGAFRLTVDGGHVTQARIAFGGMAGTPKRAIAAEQALAGVPLADEASWTTALDAISSDFQPMTDQRATSTYRSTVARNLLLKALMEIAGGDGTRLLERAAAAQRHSELRSAAPE